MHKSTILALAFAMVLAFVSVTTAMPRYQDLDFTKIVDNAETDRNMLDTDDTLLDADRNQVDTDDTPQDTDNNLRDTDDAPLDTDRNQVDTDHNLFDSDEVIDMETGTDVDSAPLGRTKRQLSGRCFCICPGFGGGCPCGIRHCS